MRAHRWANDVNIQDVYRSYLSGSAFWAAELMATIDGHKQGEALVWAESCLRHLFAIAAGDWTTEMQALESAKSCDDMEILRSLAKPFEGDVRRRLSLAVANLIVAKILYLKDLPWRARFFLNSAIGFVKHHVDEHGINPEFLFGSIPVEVLDRAVE